MACVCAGNALQVNKMSGLGRVRMSDDPEFKLKANVEISTKGGTKHVLAVTGLLLALLAVVLAFIYIFYH